jgi:hypothetical protein
LLVIRPEPHAKRLSLFGVVNLKRNLPGDIQLCLNFAGVLTRRIVMKVFAMGSFAKPITDEERQQIMRKEVPDTLKLYLEGKIEQFWFREDKPGVIFLMNTESLDQAKSIIHELPLASNGFLGFEFIPVGPLKPLGLLIQGK